MCIHYITTYRKAIPTGMISGAAAQFLASPTDLVKVQMQTEGKRLLEGKKPRWVFVGRTNPHSKQESPFP